MLRALKISLQFLTIFKVRLDPAADLQETGRAAWAFPIVGAFIGLLLVITHSALSGNLPSGLVAIVVVGLWIFLTGGLHIDGWTDCWDALAASVPPERRFEILKDSRLGTFGAVALILLLAVKIAAVAQSDLPLIMLFIAPIVGRGLMVVAVYGSEHSEAGMAAQFLSGIDVRVVQWVAILGLAPALLAGWIGIWALALAYLGAVCFRRFAQARLGTVNGDVMGAICELAEALVLLIACIR
jgi:adenosylcobinamide-GDP ribazoletransferase